MLIFVSLNLTPYELILFCHFSLGTGIHNLFIYTTYLGEFYYSEIGRNLVKIKKNK